jgi:hypothetical protein
MFSVRAAANIDRGADLRIAVQIAPLPNFFENHAGRDQDEQGDAGNLKSPGHF